MEVHKLQVIIESKITGLKKGTEKAKAEVDKATKQMNEALKKVGNTEQAQTFREFKKAVDDTLAPLKKLSTFKAKPQVETKGYAKLQQQLAKARADLEKFRAAENSTPKEVFTQEYVKLETELKKLQKEYDKAEADLEKFRSSTNKKYSTAGEDAKIKALEALDAKMSQVNAKMEAMESDGTARMANSGYTAAASKRSVQESKVADLENTAAQMRADGTAYEKNISIFKRMSNVISKLTGHFKKLHRANGDMSKGMRSSMGTGGALSKMFRTLAISARFMIASMIFRGAIDSMKQGFTDLASYSKSTYNTLTSLKSGLIQLRGSFAAAFAPILNYVAPVLNYLIEMLADAMTAVAKFFAYLTGQKTVTVAIPATRAFNDTSDAADSANNSAKELKRTLMGFDQINKLDDTSSGSGSSGSGSSGDAGSAFKTIETGANDWVELFKKAWASGDFTEIGSIIGEKLNNALENIPWDKIKATSNKIGKSIATFINGAVESINWQLVGNTIAEGLNTALEFVNGFVTNLHWGSIGTAIGDTITGFFQKIDAKKIATTLVDIIAGLDELIINAVSTMSWKDVGKKIGEFIGAGIKEIFKKLPGLLIKTLIAQMSTGEWVNEFVEGLMEGLYEGLTGKSIDIDVKLNKPFGGLGQLLFGSNATSETSGNVTAGIGLSKINWSTIGSWLFGENSTGNTSGNVSAHVGLVKKGWASLKSWIGENHTVGISLKKLNWSTIKEWIGNKVEVRIGLLKNGWSTLKSWLGIDKSFKIKLSLPKIGVKWASSNFLGAKISFPSGFYTYAKGGFPEEGPFFMNRGEIAGRFSNGKGVVANNQQITDGIAQAVGPAVYSAMVSALASSNGGNVTVTLEGDAKNLFKTVQKEANAFIAATGQPAFNY